MSRAVVIIFVLAVYLCGQGDAIRTRFNGTCLTDMLTAFGLHRVTVRLYEKKLKDGSADVNVMMSNPRGAVALLERYGIFESSDRARLLHCLTTGCHAAKPCLHNGRCVFSEHAYDKYICDCQPGYAGHSCLFDVCSSNPCLHRGTCYHTSGGYECRCRPGFSGPDCQIDRDECLSSPCSNGATCLDGENSYRCKCTAEYSGKRCHKRSLTLEDFTSLRNTVEELERDLDAMGTLQHSGAVVNTPQADPSRNTVAATAEACQGIIGWRYVPWSSWRSGEDRGRLRLENYMKKRDDTFLKITFSSVLMQNADDQCAQWSIRLDGHNCTEPAPIQTITHTYHGQQHNNYAERRPAQVIGMCRASGRGPLLRGSHAISVHVDTCPGYDSADASTGWDEGLTSFLLVEEYCPPN